MTEVVIVMVMLSMLNIIINTALWVEIDRLEKSIKKGGKLYE